MAPTISDFNDALSSFYSALFDISYFSAEEVTEELYSNLYEIDLLDLQAVHHYMVEHYVPECAMATLYNKACYDHDMPFIEQDLTKAINSLHTLTQMLGGESNG